MELNPLLIGYISLGGFLVLMFLGMPIGIAMGVAGLVGMTVLRGTAAGLNLLATTPFTTTASYSFAVIPLFMLMGEVCTNAEISTELYYAAYKWVGHLRGGLAHATILACAGFAAICGSSGATCLCMTTVAMPEMKKYNYADGLATGVVAAGGTLGILIPPSVVFMMYGVLTQQSIGKLFIAGIIPGLLLAALFMATTHLTCLRNPRWGPPGNKSTWKERAVSLKYTWTVLVLFVVIMGGIFLGFFTPTEAAGIGVLGAFIIGLAKRKINSKNFVKSLTDTGWLSGMGLTIVIGAMMFGALLTMSRLASVIVNFISTLEANRYIIIVIIIFMYAVLGMIMDSLAMMLITLPFIYPIVVNLGFSPIWFGVIMVVMCEMGQITPPVGMNLFNLVGVTGVDLWVVGKGAIPYVGAMLVLLIIITAFPQIATFLPQFMNY